MDGLQWVWVLGAVAACTGNVSDSNATTPNGPGPTPTRVTPEDPELVPVAPVARRLTRDEYLHTVADVMGVEVPAAARALLPVDRPVEGFTNIATGQTVLPDHVQAYAAAATAIAESAEGRSFIEARAGDCDARAVCPAFVESLGATLFRRPLVAREVEAFVALHQAVLDQDASDAEARRAVAEAMLQAPQFLYLLEVERADFVGLRAVGGYEMASRLSYLLWASAPDEALYAAASAGELDEPSGILAQVDRMLAERDKVERVLERYILDWSRLESIPDDDGRRDELLATAAAFYIDHAQSGRPLFELLTTSQAFLTPALAEGLGLSPRGDGIQTYDLSSAPGRLGLLAQPGIVAGMTNADGGAIVARGLFLQHQLFCGSPPDPPASLQDTIDEFVAAQPPDASERAIATARLERSECASCHAHFDPLAYGLAQLDHRGRFRTEDEHGNTLVTDGWIPASLAGGTEVPYEGLEDYAAALAVNPDVHRCMTQRQLEHALASRLERDHASSIERIRASFESEGGSFEALLRVLVVHDLFRLMPVQ